MDKEILNEFIQESRGLLEEIDTILSQHDIAQIKNVKKTFEDFAIRVDRMMGASKTLLQAYPGNAKLTLIGSITQKCKLLGYRGAEKATPKTESVFLGFFYDAAEAIETLIEELDKDPDLPGSAGLIEQSLNQKLEWLLKKVA